MGSERIREQPQKIREGSDGPNNDFGGSHCRSSEVYMSGMSLQSI